MAAHQTKTWSYVLCLLRRTARPCALIYSPTSRLPTHELLRKVLRASCWHMWQAVRSPDPSNQRATDKRSTSSCTKSQIAVVREPRRTGACMQTHLVPPFFHQGNHTTAAMGSGVKNSWRRHSGGNFLKRASVAVGDRPCSGRRRREQSRGPPRTVV